MLIQDLMDKGKIHPPSWLPMNTCYLTAMGSVAYGTTSDDSDYDVYGFCVPKREMTFPHLAGEIQGFGRQKKRFDQWQEHHIFDQDALGGKGREYDFTIFSIIRYFHLCMENNPNSLDSLFVPDTCIIHITKVGTLVRENRKMFLHKGCFLKLKGYSFSQLHKMSHKKPIGSRKARVEEYGFDTKFAMHTVRLLLEAEMIFTEGDLDLQRHREQLKSIRRGDWTEDRIRNWAADKELQLEEMYTKSELPWGPDEEKIKNLLLEALEIQYGNLDNIIVKPDKAIIALRNIQAELDKVSSII